MEAHNDQLTHGWLAGRAQACSGEPKDIRVKGFRRA